MKDFEQLAGSVCVLRERELLRFAGGTNIVEMDNGGLVRWSDMSKNHLQNRLSRVPQPSMLDN